MPLSPNLIHIQHESNLYKMQTGLASIHLVDVDTKNGFNFAPPVSTTSPLSSLHLNAISIMILTEPLARSISGSLPVSIQYIPHEAN